MPWPAYRELLHRWPTGAHPYGKTLLTAAVTARQCGHPTTLPASLLTAVAPLFLTPRQLTEVWTTALANALAWACEPVYDHTGIALLNPYAEDPGRLAGYRVCDVLVDHLDIDRSKPPRQSGRRRVGAALLTACGERARALTYQPTQT